MPEDRRSARVPHAVRLAQLEEIEVTVDKLVAGGEGLARFEGIPILISRSAPGDRLRVRLFERHPDYARAHPLEILVPGPGRREAPCRFFERCGGCDLQHLDDGLQTDLKAAAVSETLRRLAGSRLPEPAMIARGKAWEYRLRTQVHTAAGGTQPAVVGYFARGSRNLVAVDHCPILVPELNQLLSEIPGKLPLRPPRRIDLAAGDGGAVSSAPLVEGLPHGEIEMLISEFQYRFDARCFFQSHRGLLPELVEKVVGCWTGKQAFDLYCGVGLFSLPLARLYDSVWAVEGDRIAARYARNNARNGDLKNMQVVPQAVESWIRQLPSEPDRVVVDPPRAGLSWDVLHALLRSRPKRLTYASCHPATLARDLRRLGQTFRIESLVLLDMFPQSGHMEAVVQLVSEEGRASD